MSRYHEFLQKTFVEQGGIKERMYAARTGYRRQQNELLKRLQQENAVLKAENDRLRKELARMTGRLRGERELARLATLTRLAFTSFARAANFR